MDTMVNLKTQVDDLVVEYEIIPPNDLATCADVQRKEISLALIDIDGQLKLCEDRVAELNAEIDRLTNHADGIDYTIAVVSGVLTGMIDSFFVGETEIDRDKIQKELEKKYHTANDSAYEHKDADGHWTSSAMYHRLDDLAHHPSLGGLVASILVRYFRLVIYIDGSDGKPHIFFADKPSNDATWQAEKEQLIKAWIGAIIGGICLWLSNVAEGKYEEKKHEEMPEPLKKMVETAGSVPAVIEILKSADTWIGHMMSDVSTSQGIPGIMLSFLKELSVLPLLRDTNLPVFVDRLYREGNHNLSKWGGVVFTAAKKQTIPVIINETIVRGFYFVRRLIAEYKNHDNFIDIDWENVIPFANRTVERMMTIATGTFTAIDMADAAAHAAAKSAGNGAAFLSNFVLRVNFVGVGRFAVAVGTDVAMGVKRSNLRNERMAIMGQELHLLGAKVYYGVAELNYELADAAQAQADANSEQSIMWRSAGDTVSTLAVAYENTICAMEFYQSALCEIYQNLLQIDDYLDSIEQYNPGLREKIESILKWGQM